jgi:sterol desaturase/sphingolipid hydroxylase (fatty acid hydroxylase superfamily)
MTSAKQFLPILLGFVLGAALLEGIIRSAAGAGYNWRAYFGSLGDLVGRRLLEALPLGWALPVFAWTWEHRVFTAPLDQWWSWLLLLIGEEWCYYWYHRTSHTVRWFWATHAVHHSPNELNFASAYRLGWTGTLTGTPLFFLPLVWLGFPPMLVIAALGINLLYQFWLHAEWIPTLGWLEWVFNTPSHHRVHHASNIGYLDANFGGIVIVFDRLFGTLVTEHPDTPCRYGLVKPLHSYNPLYVAFHEWLAMLRDIRSARSLRDTIGYVFGKPGWRPDGRSATTMQLRRIVSQR